MAPYCLQNKLLAFLIHHDLALLPSLLSHHRPTQQYTLCSLSPERLLAPTEYGLPTFSGSDNSVQAEPIPEVNNHFIQPCHNSTHLHGIGYTPIIPRSLSRSFFLEFLSLPSIPMVFCLCLYLYLFYLLPSI